jgi:benzoate-CoA ligase family protein
VTGSPITAASLGIPDVFNAAAYFVDRNIHEGRGASVAIECGDERVTYADLLERINRFGTGMRDRLDVRPEERVALLLADTPAFAVCFFGAIKIGAVPIPTNTLWKAADYRYLLRDSRARVLIVSEELLPEIDRIPPSDLPALRHIVVHGNKGPGHRDVTVDSLLTAGVGDLDPFPASRDAPAFWLYSSGSTGAPKGCVHLQHDMVICAELFAKGILGITPADRCFSVAKLFFAYGLGNAGYFPLAVGATSILWPGPPTPANIYGVIERHRPTLFFSVPTGYGMMLAHEGRFDLSSVRLAVSAGEALPPALYHRFKERFGVEVIDGIGSTEALHMFISNRRGESRPGSSGVVVPGYEARILDDGGAPVAAGEIGNLWINGDSTCAAYWNQHEKSKHTMEGAWLRTGDKYSQDADGYYWYAGRTDDMLKVGGLWVSPIEVENALIEHPAVQECGIVGREDRDGLMKPAAYVVLRAGVDGTPDLAAELQRFVREKLAEYKRPRWVEFIPELPKTPTGKIQRFKLRQMAGT